nr:hypothetical protein [Tanacetum cinerariifolium]
MPASPKYDRYQSGEGYHAVPPPYKRTFMPPKPDLVFHDVPNVNETSHTAFNVELKDESEVEPSQNAPIFVQTIKQVKTPMPSVKPVEHSIPAANHKTDIPKPKSFRNSRNRKACFVLVLTKSKLVPLTATRPVTTTVLQPHVTRPRPAKTVVTKPYSPTRRNINRRPSPKPSNFPPKVTTFKAPMVNAVKGVQGNWGNPQHALKDKGVIDSVQEQLDAEKAGEDNVQQYVLFPLWSSALEDITYSDNEEDVGAEADFTNSEKTITVGPIPTTRVHKDHPMTQIISDLSTATQTRSM